MTLDPRLQALVVDGVGGVPGDEQVQPLVDRLQRLPRAPAGHDPHPADAFRPEGQHPERAPFPAADQGGELRQGPLRLQLPLAADLPAPVRAERLHVPQAQQPGQAGVVAELRVHVQGEVDRVEGQPRFQQEAQAAVAGPGHRLLVPPEQAVVHEQQVRLPLLRPPEALQGGVHREGDPLDLLPRPGHLQAVEPAVETAHLPDGQPLPHQPVELLGAHHPDYTRHPAFGQPPVPGPGRPPRGTARPALLKRRGLL